MRGVQGPSTRRGQTGLILVHLSGQCGVLCILAAGGLQKMLVLSKEATANSSRSGLVLSLFLWQ